MRPSRFLPQRHDRSALLLLAVAVGCLSGLAGVALNASIAALFRITTRLGSSPWVFLLPAAGALASRVFLRLAAGESPGHGIPEVLESISLRGGLLRFRLIFSRLVASCLTIGSGGSAGPEAPIAVTGSAIGSNVARLFFLPERHRVTLLACGCAAAIASVFNAPITGIVFTMEIILGEWSAVSLVPIGVAAVAGTQVSRFLEGNQIPFGQTVFRIGVEDILAAAVLAVAAGLAGALFARMIRRSRRMWQAIPVHPFARTFLGGVSVGLVGLLMPAVLGEGYSSVRGLIEGRYAPGLLLTAAACFLKMAATALTLGSGGSGGIFAPSVVAGSFMGVSFHRLMMILLPGVHWAPEGCYALLGMAGLMAGILQAPLTAIFLVMEITGGYNVILPLIVVSSLSALLCKRFEGSSFYFKELTEKGLLLRAGTDARVLSELSVGELLEHDFIPVSEAMRLKDFVDVVKVSKRDHFPVQDPSTGAFVGMINLKDIRPYIFSQELYRTVLVGEIMDPHPRTVSPESQVKDVLEFMDRAGVLSLPVVSGERFLGMISKAGILDGYRKELIVQTIS